MPPVFYGFYILEQIGDRRICTLKLADVVVEGRWNHFEAAVLARGDARAATAAGLIPPLWDARVIDPGVRHLCQFSI